WEGASFDTSHWEKALAIGNYGDGPWGAIGAGDNDGVYGPQSTGIHGGVRLIYAPVNEAITIRGLEGNMAYAARYFDPVSGKTTTSKASVKADASGSWTCPPPEGNNHDWVLVLEAKK
ncbi:MAG: putative collagen-binding domain-containing protein, partial [Verrucomicrobiota bacterium]